MAARIDEEVPDVDVLLAMAPEDLAPVLLRIGHQSTQQSGHFHPGQIKPRWKGDPGDGDHQQGYPRARESDIHRALAEGWQWLRTQGLIVPAPHEGGWMILSRRGQKLLDTNAFQEYRRAANFSKELLHSSIADKVWLNLARGDLADAVFTAFRAVEEAVREAGGFADTDIGVDLMRDAFNWKTGPLADQNQPKAEREALAHLFAGAIGSYKNPHSHRTVKLSDPLEAQEMVLLASHLLRIVDARRP